MTGIATGDQAIFVRRDAFQAAGAFPPIALMEDIALCKRLKRISPPLCLRERVVTSARRWENNGILSTIVLMWGLRLAYFFGADPNKLAQRYGYE
jgi:ABC-type glycerol-3-phosphate transport system substrate-binding protein